MQRCVARAPQEQCKWSDYFARSCTLFLPDLTLACRVSYVVFRFFVHVRDQASCLSRLLEVSSTENTVRPCCFFGSALPPSRFFADVVVVAQGKDVLNQKYVLNMLLHMHMKLDNVGTRFARF